MKKVNLLVMVVLMLFSTLSFSQEKIDTYQLSYFQKTFDITASETDFYLKVQSADRDKVSLMFDVNDAKLFIEIIDSLKSKYIEWSKLAVKNNITELDKEIDIDILKSKNNKIFGCAFGYSKWYFDYNVKLMARFKIIEGETLLIIQNTYKLKSSSNQYIDADGFYIVFSDLDEINSFMKKITKENVVNFYNEKNNKEDVFK